MNVIYERCCGMDVHKKTIVACVLSGKKKEIRSFSTMTASLLSLVDWLKSVDCQCVAMEALKRLKAFGYTVTIDQQIGTSTA
jgi:hypothetical protein